LTQQVSYAASWAKKCVECLMITLRKAVPDDLDFLVWIDLEDEGVTPSYKDEWTDAEFAAHRGRMKENINHDDAIGFVLVDDVSKERVGGIFARFRDRLEEALSSESIFNKIEMKHFPGDGRFCEIIQLWVHPDYRRRGLATNLKRELEKESLARGIRTVYTHTEEKNTHVVELNLKLGYFEVRRDPIWDEITRDSLIKHLGNDRVEQTD